jgi:hypothetical protein
LEGKRTGRPKGSKNNADAWADVRWGYEHRHEDFGYPPSGAALLWWQFASFCPDEIEYFLAAWDQL